MTQRTRGADLRRRHIKRWLAKRNRYQFGQPKSRLVGAGAVACTDTCIQHIVKLATGKNVSLDEIRRRSGGPRNGSRGLLPSETLRVLRYYGLPYEVRSDLSAAKLARIIRNRGPVIIAEQYWAHPHWKGFRYLFKTLRGWTLDSRQRRRFVGVARLHGKTGRSGLTQWTFRGNHAVLGAWATVRGLDGDSPTVIGVRDPNHNSAYRPERPKWDELSTQQVNRMLDSIRPAYGGKRLVFVPRRRVVKGR